MNSTNELLTGTSVIKRILSLKKEKESKRKDLEKSNFKILSKRGKKLMRQVP